MNNHDQTLPCQCVNTKIGSLAIKGGIKPVIIVELATDDGEIVIKFFNVNLTAKNNYTVDRNSAFAKLYRLTIGENPVPRFSRCDKLLNHFIGYQFLVAFEQATCKRTGNYLRATNIQPVFPVIGDSWTITGHLIKNVRKKPIKNQAIFEPSLSKNQAIFEHFLGNADSTLDKTAPSLEHGLNPIQHPLSKIETYSIPITKYIDSNTKGVTQPPPDILCLESAIEPKQNFLH
jgi:hypothetical protein